MSPKPYAGDAIVARNAKTNRLIIALVAAGIVAIVSLVSVGLFYQVRSNAKLLEVARVNKANGDANKINGDEIRQAVDLLVAATGSDAQAHQGQVLAGAIDELRRSIDCVALYDIGARPPACADTDARMDSLLAGNDPFTTPAKGP